MAAHGSISGDAEPDDAEVGSGWRSDQIEHSITDEDYVYVHQIAL
jgi:hypothetical protein